MLLYSKFTVILLITLLYCAGISYAKQNNNISFEWTIALPESQGMSAEKLEEMRLLLKRRGTKALLVIRNDQIVLEWYARGRTAAEKHYTASLAKSLVGGMALLVALNDESIKVDDYVADYIAQWRNDAQKSKITIKMLATHSSGMEHAVENNLPLKKIPGWKGTFWRRDQNPFIIVRDQTPIIFQPGEQYAYSGPGYAMLGYAITASIKDTSHKNIYQLLNDRIMRPIGINENEWSISYNNSAYETDGMNVYAVWGGGNYSARAVARVARLMLQGGSWEGKQLIDSEWVKKMTSYAGTAMPERSPGNPVPALGLCWFTNFDKVWPSLPSDTFVGAGAGHQILLVVPSLNLIVVRLGNSLTEFRGFYGFIEENIIEPIFGDRKKESFWSSTEKYILNTISKSIID